jgi:uncharacterized protein YpmB
LKKKILLVLIILICFTVVTVLFIHQKNKNYENTVTNSVENSTKVVFGLNTNETPTINVNGENTGVYIGQDNNYTYYSLKINKEASSEEQALSLIQGIADMIRLYYRNKFCSNR